MFTIFKSQPFRDPQLGVLVRSRGLWRGSITLAPSVTAPLALWGTRKEPNAQALVSAREAIDSFSSWRTDIEQSLFDYFQPYIEETAADELVDPSEPVPHIATPVEVWPHVSLVFVSVTPLSGVLTTELGYLTKWDEEHTLGARFQSGRFIELCGSVLAP